MAEDGEHRRLAGPSAGMESVSGEGARRAWAKPAMQRFSLQRTLAGSGGAHDVTHPLSGVSL
jgi:hypothetical protein